MTVQYTEVAVASDPYAYSEILIDNTLVVKEYDSVNDRITYSTAACTGANTTNLVAAFPDYETPESYYGSDFRTLRVNQASGQMDRSVIIEEAFDTPAPSAIYGGMVKPSGSMEGAFRPWDMGGLFGSYPLDFSPFLMGVMGYQTPAAIKSSDTDSVGCDALDGYRYYISTVPATLALKITDVAARHAAGRGGTHVYRGVGISNAEIRLEALKYAMIKADFVGRKEEIFDAAYSSATAVSGEPAMFYNATLKWSSELETGQAQSGGSTTIVLATDASTSDDYYNNMVIYITTGIGAGQFRTITDYTGSSKSAVVAAWDTNPDSTSEYRIYNNAEAFKCNNFTLSLARTIETDSVSLIGSEYIADLVYSGMVSLKGTIGLDPNEWKRLRSVAAGGASSSQYIIDQGKREYFGSTCNDDVLANYIPSGRLEITLHTTNGKKAVSYINMVTAKLTNMNYSKQGQNPMEKSIEFQGQMATSTDFYIDVFNIL